MNENFDYTNLANRPAGKFVRIGSKFVPGIRKVQAQIVPYADSWQMANQEALQQTGPLWVVLGDSMSQGIGASTYDNGWVGVLQRMLRKAGKKYRIVNLSVSGARVADVIERQLPALRDLRIKPDLVTVLIGSNDMVRKKYRQNLLENYRALLEALPTETFLMSPFGNYGIGQAANRLIDEQAPQRGVAVVENKLNTGLSSWKGKLAEDHFHPNNEGYRAFAELFYDALIKIN